MCAVTSTLIVKIELVSCGNESVGEGSVEERVPRIDLRKLKNKQTVLLKYQA